MTDYVAIPFRAACHSLRRRRFSIAGWFARARERAVLRSLSDEALKDCGLSRADVEGEIRRLRR